MLSDSDNNSEQKESIKLPSNVDQLIDPFPSSSISQTIHIIKLEQISAIKYYTWYCVISVS